jgi:SAM-dependent methyltransferase
MDEEINIRESGYSNIDRSVDPADYVHKLDQRAASVFWNEMKRQMLALLDIQEGDHVIDVGCGTGDDVREIAKYVGPKGRAVGVDFSLIMVEEARRRGNLGLPVEFYVGNAQSLEFPDQSFDCCRVERVLQHLNDPSKAVAELTRVAKSGARVVIIEPDYGATRIEGGDPIITRKLIEARCAHFRNGRVGMLLPLLFKQQGLVEVSLKMTRLETTSLAANDEQRLRENYVEPALARGLIAGTEGDIWISSLKEAVGMKRYLHSMSLFLTSGKKPLLKT